VILSDTNVISELMRTEPNPRVLAWFAVEDSSEFHLSAVGKLSYGGEQRCCPRGSDAIYWSRRST